MKMRIGLVLAYGWQNMLRRQRKAIKERNGKCGSFMKLHPIDLCQEEGFGMEQEDQRGSFSIALSFLLEILEKVGEIYLRSHLLSPARGVELELISAQSDRVGQQLKEQEVTQLGLSH